MRFGFVFKLVVLGVIAINNACSVSPGRMAIYDDAQVAREFDAELADAGSPLDAASQRSEVGMADARPISTDAGPPPAYAFTGIWSIFDQSSLLYARELDLNLSLVIGAFPYVYTGTISSEGDFDLKGNSLMRSGCADARVTGSFNRNSSFYTLRHTSCNGQLQAFTSDLRGSFQESYALQRSGIYRLTGTVVADLQGCFGGQTGPYELVYGVSIDPSTGNIAIYTAQDLIDQPMVYLGSYSGTDDNFTTLHQPFIGSMDAVTSFRGQFEQFGSNDPVRLIGQRDVIDPQTFCSFTLAIEGSRITSP